MLVLLLEAVLLISLLKMMVDEEISLLGAAGIALLTSIATTLLAMALITQIGIAGLFIAVAVSCGALGAALSAMFGIEIKRAFLIAGIFLAGDLAIRLCLAILMGTCTGTGT